MTSISADSEKLGLTFYAETSVFDEAAAIEKRIGFRFTDICARKYPNGFIGVIVNWEASGDESHNVSHGTLGCKMYAVENVSLEVCFPELTYRIGDNDWDTNFEIEVGISSLFENGKVPYEPLFFQNLKYGVEVWFGPKDWDLNGETLAEHVV
jgi:hypothetical protein